MDAKVVASIVMPGMFTLIKIVSDIMMLYDTSRVVHNCDIKSLQELKCLCCFYYPSFVEIHEVVLFSSGMFIHVLTSFIMILLIEMSTDLVDVNVR